ncbi:hypothetical protein ABZY04_32855, partial [Streptomyces sp. NPDC002922]
MTTAEPRPGREAAGNSDVRGDVTSGSGGSMNVRLPAPRTPEPRAAPTGPPKPPAPTRSRQAR